MQSRIHYRGRSPRIAVLTQTVALCLALSSTAWGEWDWYAGTIVPYSARNTSGSIAEQVQAALDGGLDWVVLAGRGEEGHHSGLQDILKEYELSTPRLIPLAATRWLPDALGPGTASLILFGVDPRAPIPSDSLSGAIAWTESQLGVSIISSLQDIPGQSTSRWETPVAFLAVQGGGWSPDLEVGGRWDGLLAEGRRVWAIGADSGDTGSGASSRTYVWAEQSRDDEIVAAIRRGAMHITNHQGIRLDLQVNGQGAGQTALINRDAFVRLRVTSPVRVRRIDLISEGSVIWSAHPDSTFWEGRFFLPMATHSYLRAAVYGPAANGSDDELLAVGNPVFVVSELGTVGTELPIHEPEPILADAAYVEVDGALQAAANLPLQPGLQVLGEFLRDLRMRVATVRVLQDREDLVSDRHLHSLTRHSDAEIRLGSLFALVARAPAELPDLLIGKLTDPHPAVRRYSARMLAQFTEGLQKPQVSWILRETDAATRSFLIRSMTPSRYHPELTANLIHLSNSSDVSVSAASVNKLIQLGTSSYKVIQALLDSAQAGNTSALEPVAWIRDRRAIDQLEKLHLQSPPGALKRLSFLALQKMEAPYPGRKRLICPLLSMEPTIDGIDNEAVWDHAEILSGFTHDWDGAPPSDDRFQARIGSYDRNLYLAFRCDSNRRPAPTIQHWRRDADGAPLGERLEIALSTAEGSGIPFILAIDPMGIPADRLGDNLTWDPEWESASQRTATGWTVETRIPLESLGLEPGARAAGLRFNLAYIDAGGNDRWSWSTTYGEPEDPERFGDLSLPRTDAGGVR